MTPTPESRIVKVYVWEAPVRITHWLIALSIVVLSVTGFYIWISFISVPGRACDLLFMGWI